MVVLAAKAILILMVPVSEVGSVGVTRVEAESVNAKAILIPMVPVSEVGSVGVTRVEAESVNATANESHLDTWLQVSLTTFKDLVQGVVISVGS